MRTKIYMVKQESTVLSDLAKDSESSFNAFECGNPYEFKSGMCSKNTENSEMRSKNPERFKSLENSQERTQARELIL